jgi:hypothetical protein
MPMLITKFHRLIQSRLLWATFLIIIVFSFVVWGTRMPKQSRAAADANAEGKLNDKPVSREEFRKAYFDTYMSVVLAVGKPINVTKKIDDEIRKSAWRRIVALKQARDLGLGAADDEVRATIQSHPGFTTDGRFNPNQYNAFIQNFLGSLGFSEIQFEEHVRGEIALQKLQYMVQQAVLVPPSDINRTFQSLSDKFDIEYVAMTVTNFEKEVIVTREDAHKYFLADPELFKIPEMVRVRYVKLPVGKYLSEATVTNEDEALAYYDEHIDDYRVTNTVTETVTNFFAAASNAVETVVTSKVVTLDFDQVKTNIFDAMTLQAAKDRAAEMATDFVVSLAPDRDGNSPKFEDSATKAGLDVAKLDPFALEDKVPGVDAGLMFNHVAFNLTMAPDEYFSDAVIGSNYVYVIALDEKISARVPEFDEVADKVLIAARENALAETLSKKANEIREAAVKAVDKGETFAQAIKAYDLKPVKMTEFTATEASELTNDYIDVILRGILPRNQGEVTDLLSTDDAVVIAYVAKRTPGSEAGLDSLKPRIEETVKRQRARILFEDFQDYLLKQAKFEDRVKAAAAAEEGIDDTNDVPQEESEPQQNPF